MQVNGEFQYTYSALRRMVVETYGRNGRIMRMAGPVVALGGLLGLILRGVDGQILAILFCGLFATAAPDIVALVSWFTQRRMFAHPFRYTITDTAAEIRSASSTFQVTWTGLTWVRTRPDMWLLRHGAATIAIPRAAFTPADQAAVDSITAGVKTA
ncbi:YcxB family protein [Actinoplanes awajinensis]|uniref:YcxB-like C-terminal domain-containing protein n=1 Tax=Actinoplanes awajinensis subsp. mycoplanecinus TaxID=135947 RepID=A0A117MRU7_9ACTN|nr:YcxB family protein [Actinoplanes awajinensis]KUL32319.1 hypothetical protein ADL15_20025 [Actinoplanes awajinensis subsp. mycoplanecinus]